MDKLQFFDLGIDITYDSNPGILPWVDTITPTHKNRTGLKYTVSKRWAPELLNIMRGTNADNLALAPLSIQEIFSNELYARRSIADLLDNGPKGQCVINKHLTLMKHQQLGREIAKIRNRWAFFYDTRTGKTPLSLSIIHDDIVANPEHKWLVVCPLILIENAWLPDAQEFFPDMKVINCHDTTPAKRRAKLSQQANVYITNVESFVNYAYDFKAMRFEGCVVDESSTMKSAKSKQSKALVEFAWSLKRFYLLSGTPAPNGEHEYYMQLKAIDPYCVPQSYTKFKEYYFDNVSYNPQFEKLKLKDNRAKELQDMIKKYALYMDKEDVLTTPGRTFTEMILKMPPGLKKHYTKMKNELFVGLDEHLSITAMSAVAKLNKLNQISSGFIIDTLAAKEQKVLGHTDQTINHLLDDFRFNALQNLLICLGNVQVLVWANYKYEFEIIKERLGNDCACIYGETSLQDKNKAIADFKAGKIKYLIANPASADKGLTLTNAYHAVYFSLTWSYELFKQSTERIYGDVSKQPNHCQYYILMAEGTIDEVLYREVLQGKSEASYAVLNHLKSKVANDEY